MTQLATWGREVVGVDTAAGAWNPGRRTVNTTNTYRNCRLSDDDQMAANKRQISAHAHSHQPYINTHIHIHSSQVWQVRSHGEAAAPKCVLCPPQKSNKHHFEQLSFSDMHSSVSSCPQKIVLSPSKKIPFPSPIRGEVYSQMVIYIVNLKLTI